MTDRIKSDAEILRQRAEDMLRKKILETGSKLTGVDIRNFVHELEVHRLELEVQNEELRLAKEEERTSAEKYKELYDFAPSGYFTLSKKSEIVKLNLSASQTLGKERSQLKNSSFNLYVSDDTKPIFNSFLENIFSRKDKETCEVTLLVNGDLPMYVHLAGILNENAELCLVNMVDITKLKQAEAEITAKNEQLLKLDAEKDKFFSIIAHDLRGPFSAFLALTKIMAEELSDLPLSQLQEIVTSMHKSATNLYSLLENLLNWARMHQGLILFDPKLIQLLPIVEGSLAVAIEPAKKKAIEIANAIPEGILVFADTNLLQTIIRNLVSNAVKFTNNGGKIKLSAKSIPGKNIEITVSDTGIGMSCELVDNLFHLGFQTTRKGTEGEPSTGLGMILCKEFVEKHGGTIWVESEEEKGSNFKFTLPSRDPSSGLDPRRVEIN